MFKFPASILCSGVDLGVCGALGWRPYGALKLMGKHSKPLQLVGPGIAVIPLENF